MSAPKVWTQSDPLLRPVHPSSLPWYGIPAPPSASASASAAATVSVSLLNSGYLTGASYLLTTQREGQLRIPVYCALVEKGEEALLFDLGIRPVSPCLGWVRWVADEAIGPGESGAVSLSQGMKQRASKS